VNFETYAMNTTGQSDPPQPPPSLPRNVKVLGLTSLLNDVASKMAYPLVPQFLATVLHGSRLQLGIIEGLAESVSSLVKLWSGRRSDRVRSRKGLVLFGYAVATQAWHVWLRIAAGISRRRDPAGRPRAWENRVDPIGPARFPVAAEFALLFHAQVLLDVSCQRLVDLRVPGHRLFVSRDRVEIDIVPGAMTVQDAPRLPELPNEFTAFHTVICFVR
jgi:hypothetical protein